MPQIITPAVMAAIFQSFNFTFQDAFKGVGPQWQRVAMEVNSTSAIENFGWLGQMPRFREWVGDRVVGSLDSFGYQIKNREFELTVGVPRTQIEDDSYGLFRPVFAEMGRATASFPDELVFELLRSGFSANCYDGQCFFDADHPVKDASGKEKPVSNMQAGDGPAWFLMDTTRSVKPLVFQKRRPFDFIAKTDSRQSDHVFMAKEYLYGVDGRCNAGFGLWQLAFGSKASLNRDNFRALRQAMIMQRMDYDRPAGIKPNLLVVGSSLEQTARDLIKSKFLPVGGEPGKPVAAGQIGMIDNTDQDIVEIFVSPYLD